MSASFFLPGQYTSEFKKAVQKTLEDIKRGSRDVIKFDEDGKKIVVKEKIFTTINVYDEEFNELEESNEIKIEMKISLTFEDFKKGIENVIDIEKVEEVTFDDLDITQEIKQGNKKRVVDYIVKKAKAAEKDPRKVPLEWKRLPKTSDEFLIMLYERGLKVFVDDAITQKTTIKENWNTTPEKTKEIFDTYFTVDREKGDFKLKDGKRQINPSVLHDIERVKSKGVAKDHTKTLSLNPFLNDDYSGTDSDSDSGEEFLKLVKKTANPFLNEGDTNSKPDKDRFDDVINDLFKR